MHGPIVTTLAENPLLTLFLVIGLGYLLGEISFFGFRLGIVGVLFVGLGMGPLGPSISVPEVIPTLGLILFIYTIGIQSGPEFFKSLRERGYRDSVFALVIVILGAGVTLLVSRPAHLTRPRAAGLYTGAMTNTPVLAAARELLGERLSDGRHRGAGLVRRLAPVVEAGDGATRGRSGDPCPQLCGDESRRDRSHGGGGSAAAS
jgi:AspT/YidE/YbjL antiporter-like protein